MAGTENAAAPGEGRGMFERVLESGWVLYIVGFEAFLIAVVVLALQLMPSNTFQGVIVGMAISLAIMTAVVTVVVFAAIAIRDRRG